MGKLDDVEQGKLIIVVEVSSADKWDAIVNDSNLGKKIYFRSVKDINELDSLDENLLHLVPYTIWQNMTQRNLYNEM